VTLALTGRPLQGLGGYWPLNGAPRPIGAWNLNAASDSASRTYYGNPHPLAVPIAPENCARIDSPRTSNSRSPHCSHPISTATKAHDGACEVSGMRCALLSDARAPRPAPPISIFTKPPHPDGLIKTRRSRFPRKGQTETRRINRLPRPRATPPSNIEYMLLHVQTLIRNRNRHACSRRARWP